MNRALLERYDRPGPRYTSYPTAVEFHEGVDAARYAAHLDRASSSPAPLGLYVHLPFCEERCLYCGCNVVITRRREAARRYLDVVRREIAEVGRRLGGRRPVVQLHWGGGTPTYYAPDELRLLHGAVTEHFPVAEGAEQAVEADPRVTGAEHLAALRELGFDRLSVGVQDFDEAVQREVRRVQPCEETRQLLGRARALGFASVNFDLICGLPRQTPASFRRTLDLVVGMRPDRLAVYSYAHVPWLKGHQRRLDERLLPDAAGKLALYAAAVEALEAAGYVAIGMDHFALPGDALARAAGDGTLWRNFMGYTVQRAPELVAVGLSGIGEVSGAFFQNRRNLRRYEDAVGASGLAVERGYVLREEDLLRREVISSLMCGFRVDFGAVGEAFGIDFERHFAQELESLAPMEADGLVRRLPGSLEVPRSGRLLVRNVCMAFDAHLAARRRDGPVFSRTV